MSVGKTQQYLQHQGLEGATRLCSAIYPHLACFVHCWPLGYYVMVQQQVLNGVFLQRKVIQHFQSKVVKMAEI